MDEGEKEWRTVQEFLFHFPKCIFSLQAKVLCTADGEFVFLPLVSAVKSDSLSFFGWKRQKKENLWIIFLLNIFKISFLAENVFSWFSINFFMSLHMEIYRYHFYGGGPAKKPMGLCQGIEDKTWNKRSLFVYFKEKSNFLSRASVFSWAFAEK